MTMPALGAGSGREPQPSPAPLASLACVQDGVVSPGELKYAMHAIGLPVTNAQALELVGLCDKDGCVAWGQSNALGVLRCYRHMLTCCVACIAVTATSSTMTLLTWCTGTRRRTKMPRQRGV